MGRSHIVFFVFFVSFSLFADNTVKEIGTTYLFKVIRIPQDYSSIQAGIEAAANGDTLLVEPGTYDGCINFMGKNIVVGSRFIITGDTSFISNTILKTSQLKQLITFENGEDSRAVLCGFTLLSFFCSLDGKGIYIKNASPTLSNLLIKTNKRSRSLKKTLVYGGSGGGMYFQNSNSKIFNISITQNWAQYGGGIYAENSKLELKKVYIYDNSVYGGGYSFTGAGGGICCRYSDLALTNCTITKNLSQGYIIYGGGIESYLSSIKLVNVTITENRFTNKSDTSDTMFGGAIYLDSHSKIEVVNSILWNNLPQEVYFGEFDDSSRIIISHSNLTGGKESIISNDTNKIFWLEGNISDNPLFADLVLGNYHLTEASPCKDVGV